MCILISSVGIHFFEISVASRGGMIRIYQNKFREINSIDPFQFAYLCRIAQTAKEEEANIKRGVSQCIRANNERMADICRSTGNFKENINICFALWHHFR